MSSKILASWSFLGRFLLVTLRQLTEHMLTIISPYTLS